MLSLIIELTLLKASLHAIAQGWRDDPNGRIAPRQHTEFSFSDAATTDNQAAFTGNVRKEWKVIHGSRFCIQARILVVFTLPRVVEITRISTVDSFIAAC